ncbi:hypothetical protein [Evansella halocellulosilytica]|uniref:hypothetical protein n=1 Tax=Evansella halocellulosilytica TaxID=2011013 RepID=UPI000BB8E2A2|nr:hypothetical protein [Evansella halocellulosilytica]
MKRVAFIILFFTLPLFTACSDENSSSDLEDYEDYTDSDIDTLISTNENLANQLEQEREQMKEMLDTIDELKEENAQLKDDILTYKQQVIEVDNLRDTERQLRNELDERSKEIFQAMHEVDHVSLEELVGDNITVFSDNETIEIENEEGIVNTFHYLKLDQVNYVRQTLFQYHEEDELFTLEYTFFTAGDKDVRFDFEVILTYKNDDGWKLNSIMYN